jgi:hypothetical protein
MHCDYYYGTLPDAIFIPKKEENICVGLIGGLTNSYK